MKIMLAMKNETGKIWLIRNEAASATKITMNASSSGTNAATIAPKTKISTRNATGSALISVARSLSAVVSNVVFMLPKPLVTTVKPSSPSSSCSVSNSGSTWPDASSRSPTSLAWTIVVWRSAETSASSPAAGPS